MHNYAFLLSQQILSGLNELLSSFQVLEQSIFALQWKESSFSDCSSDSCPEPEVNIVKVESPGKLK